jgi:predicted RNase H-like HicB family nuclease
MKLKLTEELWKEGNMYISYCPELDIAAFGETVDQAKKNLTEVILIN